MKLWLPVFLCITTVTSFAQNKGVSGIVFDKESNGRIAKVGIRNTNNGKTVYNTFKGEFEISANIGDTLIFTKPDHYADTIKIKSFSPLAIYMRPAAIQLQEVTIRDTMLSPQKKLQQIKSEYSKIYGSISTNDFLVSAPGGVGVGLGIDALYNAFSRSGRNAEHLRGIINQDYKQNVIDYRFNKTFVASVTKLIDPQLTEFMLKYRPGYYQVTTFNDYAFIYSIRANLKRYLRNPRSFDLPTLPIMPPPAK